jgi:hypothetical protein
MAGGTRACINLITSNRKQSSVAKLFMMKSAAVRMVYSQLDRILRIAPGGSQALRRYVAHIYTPIFDFVDCPVIMVDLGIR